MMDSFWRPLGSILVRGGGCRVLETLGFEGNIHRTSRCEEDLHLSAHKYARHTQKPSPESWGRGPLWLGRILNAVVVVIQVSGGCRAIEIARRANLFLAGVG